MQMLQKLMLNNINALNLGRTRKKGNNNLGHWGQNSYLCTCIASQGMLVGIYKLVRSWVGSGVPYRWNGVFSSGGKLPSSWVIAINRHVLGGVIQLVKVLSVCFRWRWPLLRRSMRTSTFFIGRSTLIFLWRSRSIVLSVEALLETSIFPLLFLVYGFSWLGFLAPQGWFRFTPCKIFIIVLEHIIYVSLQLWVLKLFSPCYWIISTSIFLFPFWANYLAGTIPVLITIGLHEWLFNDLHFFPTLAKSFRSAERICLLRWWSIQHMVEIPRVSVVIVTH